MKSLYFFIGLLLTINNLSAQKKITENASSNNKNDVYVHLKFANNIIVKNWNKNEISVEATVNLDDNKHNNYFSLKSENIGDTYKIVSNYGEYFKKYRSYTNNDDKEISTSRHKDIVNYIIYVPNNMQLKVKSISGDVEAENFVGALKLDLISGNITVKKHSKEMQLKTISGDIDIYVADAKLEAKTLTGGVYSNLEINFDKNKKTGFGSKIVTTINKGTAFLKLNTISGDIYLRKI
ncbi:DUF4097 family beta strand repeat protein [Polaribacter vadi]|uniref:DUF4097 family beta strand repeat-containing protein n=1 Tax=Polaribacter TaxID=52959 RepID=UPI001C097B12|nr:MULTISPECIES: DUF4097 family beta strand repeat-containing protein [Polaribacter]MBU3010209.1 DUF4097 family beta strand repeat protein [Polaribacter vadi]MDO6740016.1 DUF4097 family beta strand repeat-containing protein [Polaribacter sp. 1_MG-2023]